MSPCQLSTLVWPTESLLNSDLDCCWSLHSSPGVMERCLCGCRKQQLDSRFQSVRDCLSFCRSKSQRGLLVRGAQTGATGPAGSPRAGVLAVLSSGPLPCQARMVPPHPRVPQHGSPESHVRPCGGAGSLFPKPSLDVSLKTPHVSAGGQALCPCSSIFGP